MDGTAGTLPVVGITAGPGLVIQTLQVVGGRADIAAVEGPDGATLQTGVDVDMRVELVVLGDLQVLVAQHVGLVYHLTASHEAVRLVKGQGTLDTLQQVGVVNGGHADADAPSTCMQWAGETQRLAHLEQLVALDALPVVQLGASRPAALSHLTMTFATDEAGPRGDQTLITQELEAGLVNKAQAV